MFLDALPLWLSATLFVFVPTALAMAGTVWVRKWIGLERLQPNNEVAGFKFATVGVIYAVLLAFAVIVVWEKFSDAEEHVANEAGAAATLYRLIDGVDGEPRTAIRMALTAYLQSAVEHDWPAMERGRASLATTRANSALYAAALTYRPADYRGAMLLEEILHQLDLLTEARRARVVESAGVVPGVLWWVLYAGALIAIGFTFFFGSENLPAQSLMTGGLAVLIFSGLLVIVALDKPFAGAVKVEPEGLIEVMHELGEVTVGKR